MLTLRPATDADWAVAWEIQREGFRELVTRAAGGWDDDAERKCAEEWVAAQTRMVSMDGRTVGWVRLEHRVDHDWLDLVVLHPEHQGRGLGTRLMQRLMEQANARGVPLWLSVYRINHARRLYARLGFAELARDQIRVFMVFPPDTPLEPPR